MIDRANPSDLSFFSRSSPQWIEIIKQRDSYIFFSVWGRDAFLSLAAYFTIFPAILLFRRWYSASVNEPNKSESYQEYSRSYIRETDIWAYGVIIVCGALFIIGGVFVEWYPLPLVVQLQVVRSSYLLVNVAIIYVAWLLWESVQRSRQKVTVSAGTYSTIHRRFIAVIGTVVPVCLATLFMTPSTNQLILGSVILFGWWMYFHLNRLNFLWKAAGGLICLVTILWFRGFFLKALDWRILRVALIGFVFVELVHFFANWRDWGKVRSLTANCLVITTALALITLNFSRLEQVLMKGQLTHHINLPDKRPHSDWRDVGQWCQENTPIEAIFFVPRDIQGFRIHSRRSIVGDWKDGAPCVFSERYAKKWWARMADFSGYDSFDETRFNQLKGKYGASFAVTRKSQQLNFPIVYQNNGFVVYSLDK